jgi:hypothetical protein
MSSCLIQEVISIFLYFLILVLLPKIWYILDKVLWASEKMCILCLLSGIFCIFPWSMVLFNSEVYFACFCLCNLSIGESGMFLGGSTYGFMSSNTCFINWWTQYSVGPYLLLLSLLDNFLNQHEVILYLLIFVWSLFCKIWM